ncbi:MAG: hypothetical protein JXR48_03890 [Candidatus Delongbacteria bacterium]|nr:hypothetical protein [Candidatus Delongbacteria bacterium]MBN2834088.1 hypothetical protein [Candidatus Delongbacteria bacterium]
MMYNSIVDEIIDETYSKRITWQNENPQLFQNIIYNYNFAYRAYSCVYSRDKYEFKLLFVEKKFPDQHSDWEGIAEIYFPELIVLQSSNVVGVINENNVNKDDLIRLAGAIESNNEGMNSFINLFKK